MRYSNSGARGYVNARNAREGSGPTAEDLIRLQAEVQAIREAERKTREEVERDEDK